MGDMDLVETLGINSDGRLSVKREMTGLAGKRADAPACRRIGQEGEDYAAEYLQSLGYRLFERNYRYRHREIDLIMEEEGVLVFIEVKTRAPGAFQAAPYAVDRRKQMFLYSAASRYVRERALAVDVRFDIVWIEKGPGGKFRLVAHIRNAFSPLGG